MRLLGAKNVSELGPRFVSEQQQGSDNGVARPGTNGEEPQQINTRRVERDIYDGAPGLDKKGLWQRAKL